MKQNKDFKSDDVINSLKEYIDVDLSLDDINKQNNLFDGEVLKTHLRKNIDIDTPIYDTLKKEGRINIQPFKK